jgi:hypothetical protein
MKFPVDGGRNFVAAFLGKILIQGTVSKYEFLPFGSLIGKTGYYVKERSGGLRPPPL